MKKKMRQILLLTDASDMLSCFEGMVCSAEDRDAMPASVARATVARSVKIRKQLAQMMKERACTSQ